MAQLETVAFKFGGPLLTRLEELGKNEGLSRGQIARKLVVAALQEEEGIALAEELGAVSQELALVNRRLELALGTILLNLDPNARPEKVKAFVRKVLGS